MAIRNGDRPDVRLARRAVRKQIDQALGELRERWPVSDETVHDARKRLKKARAALRLARPALRAGVFRRQNTSLRDAGRLLSEIRDAKITVEAFDRLAAKAPSEAARAIRPVRDLLVTRQLSARRRLLPNREALDATLESLRDGRRLEREWPGNGGWKRLRAGLRGVYRNGHDAHVDAREHPTNERLHELRKQAKYLWQALQLLADVAPRTIARRAGDAHRLSDRLGDDHDLAVLRSRVLRAGRRVSGTARSALIRLVEARRTRLQAAAWKLGGRVYADTPRAFVKRLDAFLRRR